MATDYYLHSESILIIHRPFFSTEHKIDNSLTFTVSLLLIIVAKFDIGFILLPSRLISKTPSNLMTQTWEEDQTIN